MIRLGASLLLCLCAAACDTVEDRSEPDGGPYPPLNVIQAKGYHRSAWVQSDPVSYSPDYTGHDRPTVGVQVADRDVRVFHLSFVVHHNQHVPTTWDAGARMFGASCDNYIWLLTHEQVSCQGTLGQCLDEIEQGSPFDGFYDPGVGSHFEEGGLARLPSRSPAPIFVLLEYHPPTFPPEVLACFDTEADYIDAGLRPTETLAGLENAIAEAVDRDAIFAPNDLKRGLGTVREALDSLGWPTMERLRDHFIFILLDDGELRDAYDARRNWQASGLQDPSDPLIFTLGREGGMDDDAAFFSVPAGDLERIRRLVRQGYIVHAYSLDAGEIDAARQAGAHLLTGLELSDIHIDGPATCNPVTTELEGWPGCVPSDFERPAPE